MNNFKKRIKGAISLITAIFLVGSFMATSALANGYIEAEGMDTVAGYSTILRASGITPFSSIVYTVEKPGGEKLIIPAQADRSGDSKIDFYDFHTKTAGTYKVTANEIGTTVATSQTGKTFIVYPDEVSKERSTVNSAKLTAAANNMEKILVTVNLADKHGNAIANHIVNLVASRTGDQIIRVSKQSYTDQLGDISFLVSSLEQGVSSYTAIDLTAGTTLNQRVKIAYLSNKQAPLASGGDLSFMSTTYAQTTATVGPIHHFKIENLATQVALNQSLSFKVSGYDSNDNKVNNYTGTVRFAVTDANASLPPDYTFKPDDLGSHEFSLGLRFITPGSHKLSVMDSSDGEVKGEFVITAGGTSTAATYTTSTATSTTSVSPHTTIQRTKPVIEAPTAGKYKQRTVIVSGHAGIGDQLKMFDNNKEIGTFAADAAGKFTFQAKSLSNGKHTIRIGITDGTGNILLYSDDLVIDIDSSAPSVDEVKILPSANITKRARALIKIYSEKNLAEAAIILNNTISELTPVLGEPGAYSVSLNPPQTAGAYPIDVVVIDQLGNEGNYKAMATLNVVEPGVSIGIGEKTEGDSTVTPGTTTLPPTEGAPGLPTKVVYVKGASSDSRVTLTWDAAQDNTYIAKYKVYYGIEPNNLIVAVNTFDAATRWYVPNLTNGQTYYFAVAGIDSEGNVGPLSEVLSGKPVSGVAHPLAGAAPAVTPAAAPAATATPAPAGTATTPATSPPPTAAPVIPVPDEIPNSGPEAMIVTFVALLLAGIVVYLNPFKRRRKYFAIKVLDRD